MNRWQRPATIPPQAEDLWAFGPKRASVTDGRTRPCSLQNAAKLFAGAAVNVGC